MLRPITRGSAGRRSPLQIFSPPLDIVKKVWAPPLRKLFALLVSQTGYGPVYAHCVKVIATTIF